MINLLLFLTGLLLDTDINSNMMNGFEAYGDLMQFFCAFLTFFLFVNKDYLASAQMILGMCIALGIMYTSKLFFIYLSNHDHIELARISQRPNNGPFDGFPSGHSTGSFLAAGFICKKYGFKIGIFAIIIAALVAISRVYAGKHTVIQVICGSILGFFVTYALTDSKIFAKYLR